MSKPILLVCSVELESAPLVARLERRHEESVGHVSTWRGRLGDRAVMVATGGMGKVNAAHAVTLLTNREEVAGVIGFGVGGAYPGSGLEPGSVAIATAEHYGDEGVMTPGGWISCEGIGIPLHRSGEETYFNQFPVDEAALSEVEAAAAATGLPVTLGAFVTVSCCSGTAARGAELADRFDAVCETMEGAAYAHIAAIHGLPYLEIRGISNLVEDRDFSRWRLREAAEAASAAIAAAVEIWQPSPAASRGRTR